jgi:PAS domain S-box-containing protein
VNAASHNLESPALLECIADGLAITRSDGCLTYCSTALAASLGIGAQSPHGVPIFALLESVATDPLPELQERVYVSGAPQRIQVKSRHSGPSGSVFIARAVMRRAELPEGRVIVWSFEEIGNRPVSTLESALSGTDIGLWDWQIQPDRLVWINDWAEQAGLTAFSGAGHAKLWTARIHPDDIGPYRAALDAHLAGRSPVFAMEYRLRNPVDAWVWIRERGHVIERDADGTPIRMVGVCLDADEPHRAASALERSESRFKMAMRRGDFGFWDVDLTTDSLSWWNDWCEQLDIDACTGEAHSPRWDAVIHPDDVLGTNSYYELAAGRCDLYEAEYRVRTRSGGWRWVLSRGMATARDAAGRALRITGVTIDIDARKRMDIAVRDSETRLAMILETMQEGVVLTDATGRVEFTNRAFDRMLGHAAGELAGRSILQLLDPAQAAKLGIASLQRVLARSSSRYGKRSIALRRPDGSQFAGEVRTGSLELSGDRKTLYVVQDVSERKLLEKEITEIAHSERRRLGSDLHDGLGQELTGISLMLRGLTQRVSDGEFSAGLNEVIRFVNHAIATARTMAMGLSPVTLERGGFVTALGTLAAWARATLGVDVRLRLLIRSDLKLDEANATHLYLIAQEAILNAVKHGQARSIVVHLRTTRQLVSLAVTDDGIGIRTPAQAGGGMGLKIMEYRAGIMGGSLHVKPRKGGGTRVRCVCPHGGRSAQAGTLARKAARRSQELPLKSD